MKISNFELVNTTGEGINRVFFALVDVQTGYLWWKKTKRVGVCRNFANYWFFIETGEWCPRHAVQKLARSWTAKTGQET